MAGEGMMKGRSGVTQWVLEEMREVNELSMEEGTERYDEESFDFFF